MITLTDTQAKDPRYNLNAVFLQEHGDHDATTYFTRGPFTIGKRLGDDWTYAQGFTENTPIKDLDGSKLALLTLLMVHMGKPVDLKTFNRQVRGIDRPLDAEDQIYISSLLRVQISETKAAIRACGPEGLAAAQCIQSLRTSGKPRQDSANETLCGTAYVLIGE